jgi:DNA-binding NarL/FixJ family response regulator
MEKIRLYVVDDHPVVRMGMERMFSLENDMTVVGSASSGNEALEEIPCMAVDVVVTDLRMNGMSGDEFAGQLKSCCPSIRTVILTNFHSDEDVFRSMRAGVHAFVLKSAATEDVIAAVRSAHAGEHWFPTHIARQLARRMSRHELSARELEILQLVAEGLKNKVIAERLFISENTVKNHVKNLLEKMQTRDRTHTVTTAFRLGLVRLSDD